MTENFFMLNREKPAGGHAVDAAQVAPVGYGYAHVVYSALKTVSQTVHPSNNFLDPAIKIVIASVMKQSRLFRGDCHAPCRCLQ